MTKTVYQMLTALLVRLKCCGAYLGADVVVQPALEKRTEGLPGGLDIPTTIKLMLKL
jgi:hypothetical protein